MDGPNGAHTPGAQSALEEGALFIHRIVFTPGNGQGNALRAVLEGQVRLRQSGGYRCVLGQIIYGSDWPEFDMGFPFEALSKLEEFRSTAPSPAFQAQVSALTARPPQFELREVIVPPNGSAAVAYTTQTSLAPVPGMLAELRAALEENTRERQAAGIRTALAITRAGSPRVIVTRLLGALADLDTAPLTAAQQARTKGLFAELAVQIRQVLIPLN